MAATIPRGVTSARHGVPPFTEPHGSGGGARNGGLTWTRTKPTRRAKTKDKRQLVRRRLDPVVRLQMTMQTRGATARSGFQISKKSTGRSSCRRFALAETMSLMASRSIFARGAGKNWLTRKCRISRTQAVSLPRLSAGGAARRCWRNELQKGERQWQWMKAEELKTRKGNSKQ